MAGKLEGKVAVVTGGNSGMGLATAKLFAKEGAHVYITGRRKAELEAAVKEIGRNVTAVQGDVAKLSDIDRLYALVKEKHGRVDVVFANAGVGELVPIADVTEAHFDKLFGINVKGLLFTVQKALPLMAGGASIILNGSIAGYTGSPAFSVYSATKAAVRSFARTWTADLKERKIRVNTLSPGPIDTPIFETVVTEKDQVEQLKAGFAAQVPLGRMGRPEEIATVALFLASDDSSFVTGIDLSVDGGMAQV
ncbi:glucose 1-dehydrogenase [Gemmata sp. G18]|uniref:Glucose 1-dehydrogenase n=1 Tax=Gemmata palustris TaxID=2822762 RepID=A0ABS5BT60_9BACT|nr:glucose 1-dehydrogenase [Gemmata palustris]MBP3956913.1 glucose 1-dehydrogenase [Gemmata palustris]